LTLVASVQIVIVILLRLVPDANPARNTGRQSFLRVAKLPAYCGRRVVASGRRPAAQSHKRHCQIGEMPVADSAFMGATGFSPPGSHRSNRDDVYDLFGDGRTLAENTFKLGHCSRLVSNGWHHCSQDRCGSWCNSGEFMTIDRYFSRYSKPDFCLFRGRLATRLTNTVLRANSVAKSA
jgi:hypothetical protein